MKQVILTLGLAVCLTSVSAQSTVEERQQGSTTKSGQVILPQAGDFAIGIDASNGLNYIGNLFNGNNDNVYGSQFFDYQDNVFKGTAIYGKYFLTDNTAIRVKLHLGFGSETKKNLVQDDAAVRNSVTNADEMRVEDSFKDSKTGIGLRVGYEVRRGYGRLQGFYGAEAGLGIQGTSETYEFGNLMYVDNNNSTNNGATSTAWPTMNSSKTNDRTVKNSGGSKFSGLLGGFVGVEYFVAPKLSIGGEFGLGLLFTSTGETKKENEKISQDTNSGKYFVETKETKTAGGSTFAFATNSSASLNITFHF